MKRKPDHPPPFPPYRTHCNQHKAEKPIQSRHPTQTSPHIYCTGPTLHTAESHKENVWPGSPEKFSRTQNTKSKQNKKQVQ
jgi:hypothetical protein